MRRGILGAGALLVGLVVGGSLTLAIQSAGLVTQQSGRSVRPSRPYPALIAERPDTFLAWVPNGLPPGFAAAAAGLAGMGPVTSVAEDNVWMTRSFDASGTLVDRPTAPYMIPIDAAAVQPRTFASFLPAADRDLVKALADGQGVLGATSAELRGLGVGATLRFQGGATVTIAGVLPDELVGASELMVSRSTGSTLGVTHQRYLLLQPGADPRLPTSSRLTRELEPLLPASIPSTYRKVQVRAPGETPYFRAGDAVLPPVLLKSLFGEFAARPTPGNPGYLEIDPAWVRAHIVTTTVPVLGRVTCNRALIPQLRGAMREVQADGLTPAVHAYDGCFVPRFINRIPTAAISHHSWGVAFDCNATTNPFGAPPRQNPRFVAVMQRWGFIWGGTFIVPDGNHFEYRRAPEPGA